MSDTIQNTGAHSSPSNAQWQRRKEAAIARGQGNVRFSPALTISDELINEGLDSVEGCFKALL